MQTVLLCAFAVVFIADGGPWLLMSMTSRAVGAALCAAGLLLLLSAFVSIGSAVRIEPEPRPGSELVTRGVYRYLRHPIYTAIVMLVLGLFLRKAAISVAIAAAVVIVFLVVKVRFEEKVLLARYPEYAAYKSRTWGLVPWLRRSPGKSPG